MWRIAPEVGNKKARDLSHGSSTAFIIKNISFKIIIQISLLRSVCWLIDRFFINLAIKNKSTVNWMLYHCRSLHNFHCNSKPLEQEQTESYLSSLSSNEFPAKKEDFEITEHSKDNLIILHFLLLISKM